MFSIRIKDENLFFWSLNFCISDKLKPKVICFSEIDSSEIELFLFSIPYEGKDFLKPTLFEVEAIVGESR